MITYQVANQHRQHQIHFDMGMRPGELILYCEDCKQILDRYQQVVEVNRPFKGPYPKSATKGGKPK